MVLEIKNDFPLYDERVRWVTEVSSLKNPESVDKAVDIIKNGGIVAAQVRGVYGIWCDASSPDSVSKLHDAKGSDKNKTLSLMVPTRTIHEMVDLDAVDPSLRYLFEDETAIPEKVGSICHLRIPIDSEFIPQVPGAVRSQVDGIQVVHNLDPSGHVVNGFIEQLTEEGVSFIGVSSLGISGMESEVHDFNRAIEFCNLSPNIDLLLTDPTHSSEDVKGSFAIVDTTNKSGIRDGHVSVHVVSKILGIDLDQDSMKPAKFDNDTFVSLIGDLSGAELRKEILRLTSAH